MGKQILNKIESLKKQILRHDNLYYNLDKPEISDFEYDQIYQELVDLETRYPQWKTKDSPTQKTPGRPLDKFEKINHSQQMFSLQNTYSQDEIKDYYDRMIKHFKSSSLEFFVEPKFDGVAVELVYKKGWFQLALSRGNGVTGENITENIRTIKGIPLKLAGKQLPALLEVRGEVVIFKKDFVKINKEQNKQNLPVFANPRNLAAGSLRQLNPMIAAQRPLRFFAHSLGHSQGLKFKSQSEFMDKLREFGLPALKMVENKLKLPFLCQQIQSLPQILKYYKTLQNLRESLPFEIDGIVVKVNELKKQEELGHTARNPRWAIAGKFSTPEACTQIEDIVLQVGRTGVVTPVAIMKPTPLDGVVIRQASLHNFNEIKRKDIRKGDFVLIHRAGDVIPEVIKTLKEKRKKNLPVFSAPQKCPSCKQPLIADGDYLRCISSQCPATWERALIHFASKACMNIEFLGEKNIKKFYKWGWLKNFSSFYDLPQKPLDKKEGFGTKSFNLLIKSLEMSKKTVLSRFLFALGIAHVGEQTAHTLSDKVKEILGSKKLSLKNILPILKSLTEEELIELPDIGETVAQSITKFFQNKKMIKDLEELHKKGLVFTDQKQGGKLKGLVFVITGTLPLARPQIKKMIEEQGGKMSASVNKKVNYILVGTLPGSKKDQAEKLKIPVLSWKKFQTMV